MSEETKSAEEIAAEEKPAAEKEEARRAALTDEERAAEDKAAAEKKKAEEAQAKSGAPDKYELKLPEGVEQDDEILAGATAMFKEAGLSNEQGQAVLDYHFKHQQAHIAAWEQQLDDWKKEKEQDSELTGEAVDRAVQAVLNHEELSSKEVRDWLTESGAGYFPPLIRMLYRISKAIGEDKTTTEKTKEKGERDPLDDYPKMKAQLAAEEAAS